MSAWRERIGYNRRNSGIAEQGAITIENFVMRVSSNLHGSPKKTSIEIPLAARQTLEHTPHDRDGACFFKLDPDVDFEGFV
jgi:hypothetical protein